MDRHEEGGMKFIRESNFCNTYGGLSLVEDEEGRRFLKMEDCFGPDYYGPMSDADVEAFNRLCELPESRCAPT